MTLSTSAVAISRSKASSPSRRNRTNSVSRLATEELLWRATFRVFALRLRPLAILLLALERRRIAHPKGLGLRRFSKGDYSRDLRLAKWCSMINLRCRNWTTTEATATCLPATSQYRHPHERMGRSWRATFEIDAPCSEPQSQKDGNQAPKTLTSPVLTLWHPHPPLNFHRQEKFLAKTETGARISLH